MPPSNAPPTWRGLLLGHLERHKRFPREAQWRRQQGVVYLRFTMDRQGRVLSAKIERSAGFAALDEETLALIYRAQPLPPPPDDVPGDPLELIVPVQFFMR
jgi:protein TonB